MMGGVFTQREHGFASVGRPGACAHQLASRSALSDAGSVEKKQFTEKLTPYPLGGELPGIAARVVAARPRASRPSGGWSGAALAARLHSRA
jgi:hypothetical protein